MKSHFRGLFAVAMLSACGSSAETPAAGSMATAGTTSPAPAAQSQAPAAGRGAATPAAAGTPAAGSGSQSRSQGQNAASQAAGTSASNTGTAGATAANSGASAAGSGGSSTGPSAASAGAAGQGAQGAAGAANTSAAGATSSAESFETATTDALLDSWEISTTNCMGTGTVSTDSTQAHTGMRSVRVNGGGGYCNHVFFRPKQSPTTSGAPFYARFFVRFEKPLTQSHVTFLALRDESEMKDLRMGGQSEILMWNRESDDATLPELSPTGIAASVEPEAGKWLCVELSIDGATPKLETWIDGNPVQGLIVEGEPTPDVDAQWQRKADWRPQLSDIRFGWESYGSDENTLWYDDVLFGTSRIGCE